MKGTECFADCIILVALSISLCFTALISLIANCVALSCYHNQLCQYGSEKGGPGD